MLIKKKLHLDQVTLVLISGVNIRNSLYALWRSSLFIDFYDVIIITDKAIRNVPKPIRLVNTLGFSLDSIDSYSRYCVYELHSQIKSNFALIVQADGYVINPNSWDSIFLDFDYIGAPWPSTENAYIDPYGNHQRVGNGGFSLRSKKLLHTSKDYDVVWDVNQGDFYKHMNIGSQAEDGIICVHNRHVYEAAGNKFAPVEIAVRFSYENRVPEYVGQPTFGFHKHLPKMLDHLVDVIYRGFFYLRYPRL